MQTALSTSCLCDWVLKRSARPHKVKLITVLLWAVDLIPLNIHRVLPQDCASKSDSARHYQQDHVSKTVPARLCKSLSITLPAHGCVSKTVPASRATGPSGKTVPITQHHNASKTVPLAQQDRTSKTVPARLYQQDYTSKAVPITRHHNASMAVSASRATDCTIKGVPLTQRHCPHGCVSKTVPLAVPVTRQAARDQDPTVPLSTSSWSSFFFLLGP